MSGRNSLGLILGVVLFCGGLYAQGLPDIDQFEVENVRLILLDSNGARQGVLKGEIASKQRDGGVLVENAELKFSRKDGDFIVSAPQFIYEPDTNKFEAPEGLTATLPNDGAMSLPSGKGEVAYGDGVNFSMDTEGDATLRTGPADKALVEASLVNPSVAVTMSDNDSKLAVEEILITGNRGGELKLRLAHLPSLDQSSEGGEAVVTVSCFGNVALQVFEDAQRAKLHMERRARMALDSDGREFEVTSNKLDIAGVVLRENSEDGETTTTLTDLSIDASQNVRISGDQLNGTAAVLRYREYVERREVRLEGDAQLDMLQADEENLSATISMEAKNFIDVTIPASQDGTRPEHITAELFESARVRRRVNDRVEWQVNGSMVRVYSWLNSVNADATYNHSFDAFAEGFSPLVRVAPQPVSEPSSATAEVQQAAVYGARAEGTIIDSRAQIRVFGPEVLSVVESDLPLADLLRINLGLQPASKDPVTNQELPPPKRDGQLTVRASKTLDLDIYVGSTTTDIAVGAVGNVELDHHPLPRDDRNLLTLTGDQVRLAVREQTVQNLYVSRTDELPALATLGPDLLIAETIAIDTVGNQLITQLTGPGRLVVRHDKSVEYFRRELDRLPKREGESRTNVEPDAAWLNFDGELNIEADQISRTLEGNGAVYRLVRGEFEKPRAGRAGLDDLAELVDPEVLVLYSIRADRIYARSVSAVPGSVPVNLMRLEGSPYVDSRLDGITASAEEAIELSGSENQRAGDSPFSVVLLRNAKINVEQAGVFFGEYVQSGVFSYDGRWELRAADRLEVTMRPLEVSAAEPPTNVSFADVRRLITKAIESTKPPFHRRGLLSEAEELLAQLVDESSAPANPAAAQPVAAMVELRRAHLDARMAEARYHSGHPEYYTYSADALRAARQARALLTALLDVTGRGGVEGDFVSNNERVPPLKLAMQTALFTFNGLGGIVDVGADGPIRINRAAYSIFGDQLRHAGNGVLTLEGASITLPEDTGVRVDGVETVSLRQSDRTGTANTRRTMITRVSGKGLRVRVSLSPDENVEEKE